MEWPLALLIILGSLLVLMAMGMPISFCFMAVSIIGSFLFLGGIRGLEFLIDSIFTSVGSFIFVPVPLFILMGTVIFESGVGLLMVEALDKWMGKVPARLSILAVGAGAVLAAMIGISTASVGILGKALLPEMEKRGYDKSMSLGPILGSSQLAPLVPPSALAVFLGAIGGISISKLLVGIIIPGLLMAVLFAVYIVIRCRLQPDLAPSYDVTPMPLKEKLIFTARYLLPAGLIIFAVLGVIVFGFATPEESGALGSLACFLVAALYGRLSWQVVKRSVVNAMELSVMVFMIIAAAVCFSRLLSFTGAIVGVVNLAVALPVPPAVIFIFMQVIVVWMGMFVGPNSIIMITLPVFMPIVNVLGFNPVWFGVIMVINTQLALLTPPFGPDCYVMKAMAPKHVTLADVFISCMPFLLIGYLTIVIVSLFPSLALWLPNMMR
ncbi:MAG: TRAP transporter large permease subunit [Desulfobacterales bacterium]|nr:TRAP transporter large permease subunit [Desulfobacterales bacterium]